ncbi:hypothetical protein [Nubsella zeaxanthinifaciens]|jgi:hypothetical protein|uniref:hypothetical protein n=1 Tax=Nubsella zeaxanthinifaciens TaxID=392412 RepID=UPI000DE336AD|nr:hypothetical protein [Nubsella zeaxanthinifaciens]
MKKYVAIGLALLVSLLIYLFYRTEKTVVTCLFIQLVSAENYLLLKHSIVNAVPLNNMLIYSLPEGLWVLCITLTSKNYDINFGKWRLNCTFIPLIFCFTLELLQLFHITNGRFDIVDIIFSLVFWLLANGFWNEKMERQNLLKSRNANALICLASYCIVYLAHVFN